MDGKDLVVLGVGAVIGTGIFILPGTVAALYSGPGIVFHLFVRLSARLQRCVMLNFRLPFRLPGVPIHTEISCLVK